MLTNADQITTTKKVELENLIAEEKPALIAVCEVKTKNGKQRELIEYEIIGFKLYHCHLESESGRGIAVYVHNSLVKSVQQIRPKINFEESCLLQVKLRGSDMMLFGCIYRSPTPSLHQSKTTEV